MLRPGASAPRAAAILPLQGAIKGLGGADGAAAKNGAAKHGRSTKHMLTINHKRLQPSHATVLKFMVRPGRAAVAR